MTGTQVASVPAIIARANEPANTIKMEPSLLKTTIVSNGGAANVIGVLHTTTIVNGIGDSKKMSKDMDKKEIALNGGRHGETSPHKLSSHQIIPPSGSVVKNDCPDLDNNLVAVDLKNLKENSALVNNLKHLGVGVRVGGVAISSTPTTPLGKTTSHNSANETESSSSEDEHGGDEDECMLREKWERERLDVAWRWHWLDLQSRELQYQIQQSDQQYMKMRRNKQPVVAPVDDNDPMHSLRTIGMGTIKKSRKLCRRAPTNLSGRIMEGADQHPLFSFIERKRPKHVAVKEPSSPTNPLEKPKRKRDNKKEKSEVKTETVDDDTAPRPPRKRRNPKDESPKSPLFTPPSTPNATPKLTSDKKKKTLKTRDFDIDNVVIPFAMGSAGPIPVIQYKEILTPQWRSVSAPEFSSLSKRRKAVTTPSPLNTPNGSPYPSPLPSPSLSPVAGDSHHPTTPLPALSSSQTTVQLQLPASVLKKTSGANGAPSIKTEDPAPIIIKREDPPPARYSEISEDAVHSNSEEGSSDEDTSDEAFARRHLKQEVGERQRYLQPKKKKSADTSHSDTAITDLFVTTEDLLSSYSPVVSGSLLNDELFGGVRANNNDEKEGGVYSPVEGGSPEANSTSSLSLKKEKLKEKFAKIRSSYGAAGDTHKPETQQLRSFSAPAATTKQQQQQRAREDSGTDSDSSEVTDEEEEEDSQDDGEEEDYEAPRKKRIRKPRPSRARSARVRTRTASAQATTTTPSSIAARRSRSRSASKASPSPSSVTSPEVEVVSVKEEVVVSQPEPIMEGDKPNVDSDNEEAYERDYAQWEATITREGKWWWDPAISWEIIPPPEGTESNLIHIRIRKCTSASEGSLATENTLPRTIKPEIKEGTSSITTTTLTPIPTTTVDTLTIATIVAGISGDTPPPGGLSDAPAENASDIQPVITMPTGEPSEDTPTPSLSDPSQQCMDDNPPAPAPPTSAPAPAPTTAPAPTPTSAPEEHTEAPMPVNLEEVTIVSNFVVADMVAASSGDDTPTMRLLPPEEVGYYVAAGGPAPDVMDVVDAMNVMASSVPAGSPDEVGYYAAAAGPTPPDVMDVVDTMASSVPTGSPDEVGYAASLSTVISSISAGLPALVEAAQAQAQAQAHEDSPLVVHVDVSESTSIASIATIDTTVHVQEEPIVLVPTEFSEDNNVAQEASIEPPPQTQQQLLLQHPQPQQQLIQPQSQLQHPQPQPQEPPPQPRPPIAPLQEQLSPPSPPQQPSPHPQQQPSLDPQQPPQPPPQQLQPSPQQQQPAPQQQSSQQQSSQQQQQPPPQQQLPLPNEEAPKDTHLLDAMMASTDEMMEDILNSSEYNDDDNDNDVSAMDTTTDAEEDTEDEAQELPLPLPLPPQQHQHHTQQQQQNQHQHHTQQQQQQQQNLEHTDTDADTSTYSDTTTHTDTSTTLDDTTTSLDIYQHQHHHTFSSPPTTPPLVASPDDDIILLSPMRADPEEDDYSTTTPTTTTPTTTTTTSSSSSHHHVNTTTSPTTTAATTTTATTHTCNSYS